MHSAGQVQVLVSRKQISTKEQEEEENQQSWRGEKQFPDKPDKGGGEHSGKGKVLLLPHSHTIMSKLIHCHGSQISLFNLA